MQNSLPDLEAEDEKYDLHVGAEPITNFNITLMYQGYIPHELTIPKVPIQSPDVIKDNLKKLGIFL